MAPPFHLIDSRGVGRMRFLDRDDGRCIFRIRVDSIDDLWYLDQVIQIGTKVGAHTFRKLEAKEDQVRAYDQQSTAVLLFLRSGRKRICI